MSGILLPSVLEGLNILITGASSGIGRAAAISCAQAGVNSLILLARSEDKLKETAESIAETAHKTHVLTIGCDVRDAKAVYVAVQKSLDDSNVKQIDVLINNAGLAIGAPARFSELKLEDIDTMVSLLRNRCCYSVLLAETRCQTGPGF